MSVLGSSRWPSPDGTMEALRCLANDFLAKVRAEVDRVLFFGLGLKVDASSAIKRRMGRVLSRLGLKPKLLFGFKWRGRHRPLAVLSRFKKNVDVVRAPNAFLGQGEGEGEEEASSEEVPVVSALESEADGSDEAVSPTLSGKVLRRGVLRPGASSSPEKEVVLALGAADSCSLGEILPVRVCEKGKVASRHHSPEKGMLRQGFLLQRSSGVVTERRYLCSPEMWQHSSGSVKTPRGKVG